MLAVPVRRAGRTLGVLAVQNRAPRHYDADEVEVLETVAMLLAELLAAGGAADGDRGGRRAPPSPACSPARALVRGIALGPVVRARRPSAPPGVCWPTIPRPNCGG